MRHHAEGYYVSVNVAPHSDRSPVDDAAFGGGIGRTSGAAVGVASLIGGLSGYVALLLAARLLDPAANADFLVLWGAAFTAFGILGGIQVEATRAVHAAGSGHGGTGPRISLVGAGIGLCAAALVLITGWLWAPMLLGDGWRIAVVMLAVGITGFSVHVAIAGALAGRERWQSYAAVIAAEASMRLLLVLGAAAVVATYGGFVVAATAGTAAWALLAVASPTVRASLSARTDVQLRPLLAGIGHASVAAASTAILLVGFPVLLRLTTSGSEHESTAAIVLAVALTRGPLLIPLGAFQSVAITHFMRDPQRGLRALVPVVRVLVPVAMLAALVAALIGPPFLRAVRDEYDVSAAMFFGLTLAAALLALLTISGACCVAIGAQRWYSRGWVVATAVSFGILAAPMALSPRVVASLVVGPLVGMVVHGISVHAAGGRSRPLGPEQ